MQFYLKSTTLYEITEHLTKQEIAMFLTEDEVQELTGLVYYKSQVKWLARKGYKFEISASGAPKILRGFVEDILGGKRLERQTKFEPNLSNAKYFG